MNDIIKSNPSVALNHTDAIKNSSSKIGAGISSISESSETNLTVNVSSIDVSKTAFTSIKSFSTLLAERASNIKNISDTLDIKDTLNSNGFSGKLSK